MSLFDMLSPMIENLILANISENSSMNLFLQNRTPMFAMQTCQRSLYIHLGPVDITVHEKPGLKLHYGLDAYKFMLEVLCGLKSKLLGEYEILSQYKKSLHCYLELHNKNPHLTKILKKILSDAKAIRGDHLDSIGQKTYASLTRKLTLPRMKTDKILIIGQGQLSLDVIHQFIQHKQVYLTSRNTEKLEKHPLRSKIKLLPWEDFESFCPFSCIISCIGADSPIFNQQFFSNWTKKHPDPSQRIFINLGESRVIDTSLSAEQGIYRLDDIFEKAQVVEIQKNKKLALAQNAIYELTKKRQYSFALNYPFGWEELLFY